MTSHRDLAEARRFHRRRLASAFISGARGTPDADPGRAGRSIGYGVLLVVALLVGSLAVGHLRGRPVVRWDRPPGISGLEITPSPTVPGRSRDHHRRPRPTYPPCVTKGLAAAHG